MKDVSMTGEVFDGRAAHQLVIDGGKGVIKDCVFSGGNTSLHAELPVDGSLRSIYGEIDGGGVLIMGDVDLEFVDCTFENNYSVMCGGAVSVQANPASVVNFSGCIFKNNKAEHTGPAIDILLPGITSAVDNCVFEDNKTGRYDNGSLGQIAVFPASTLTVTNSKFINSPNDVDIDIRNSRCFEAQVEADDGIRVSHVTGRGAGRTLRRYFSMSSGVIGAWLKHPDTKPWVSQAYLKSSS